MSFENAPVSKGIMIFLAVASILVGMFDIKHFFHLQLVPHISKHHQYWRLGAHNVAVVNSSDLFLAELVLYNVGVQVERQFGSVKFASLAVVSLLVTTVLEFLSLLLFHRVGLNYIPPGPLAVIFCVLYQHARIVPAVYRFRIFGVPLSNQSFTQFLALYWALGSLPGSAAAAVIGIIAGQVYRSDLANFKSYRIPPPIVTFCSKTLRPLIGSTRGPRRSNRAQPDRTAQRTASFADAVDEVVTTARPAQPQTDMPPTSASVVREWVDELTGRSDRANAGIRVPPAEEVTQVTNMFPDMSQATVISVLQQSPNIAIAVETLLGSQG